MHLVLIETAGNQRFIFATNKLRENVGASELTYRAGTEWVLEADERLSGLWPDNGSTTELRKNLLKQPPIGTPGVSIEVIVATSGKAILLVEGKNQGKEIIRYVTRKALEEAPGINVCGVVGEPFELNQKPLGDAIREVHQQLERIRDNRPGAALRFLRLPVVMDCATSGLPASCWVKPGPEENETAFSVVTLAKRTWSECYRRRMKTLLSFHQSDAEFARNVTMLEKYCDWLAVVHADGNGVGQIFRRFWKNSGCEARDRNKEALTEINRDFIDRYRRFSIALDVCTEEAFLSALTNLRSWKDELRSLKRIKESRDFVVPILPIVLGGDDLTVMCDGQAALQFMQNFLKEFEKQTERLNTGDAVLKSQLADIIPDVAEQAHGVRRLSASAGIAIIKPHFPFSAGYELAEQLIKSAKCVKNILRNKQGVSYPCSALDFHVLYDASGSDLNRIREKLLINEETLIHARPYVIPSADLLSSIPEQQEWIRHHDWRELEKRVTAIFTRDDDGRRKLPNSQLHDLRGGLFLGYAAADARYRLIRRRYRDHGITAFDESGTNANASLFFAEGIENRGQSKEIYRTRLLDSLDAANFWIEKQQETGEVV